jgi:Family of unknown function (DUF5681)
MKPIANCETEITADYEVGYGRPPRHGGFPKGQSGNPQGRPRGSKNLATLLAEALDEKVQITEDGKRRRVTKRELVVKQLVNKSAAADLRAIKQLTDIVQGVERRAEAAPTPAPPALTTADEEVIAELRKRIERAIRAKIEGETPLAAIVTPANAGSQESTGLGHLGFPRARNDED